jgi:hypothetical protein
MSARRPRDAASKLLGAVALGLSSAETIEIARRGAPQAPSVAASPGPTGAKGMLQASAALLAASVLIDSAIEHYRGSFKNPGMYVPLLSSTLALLSGAEGAARSARAWRPVRRSSYKMAVAVGAVGTAFHLYDISRRPGGFGWLNLFYGAPLGAPPALTVSGLLGLCAEELQNAPDGSAKLKGLSAGRVIAALNAVALAGTVAEVALLHFRGAFQNPFMWAPVTLPPVASGLMAKAAVERPARRYPLTRIWLWLTTALGFVGLGFHAYGVSRAMGGWRNWSQNLLDGPPLPAPPSFSALAIASLSAVDLLQEEAREADLKDKAA